MKLADIQVIVIKENTSDYQAFLIGNLYGEVACFNSTGTLCIDVFPMSKKTIVEETLISTQDTEVLKRLFDRSYQFINTEDPRISLEYKNLIKEKF